MGAKTHLPANTDLTIYSHPDGAIWKERKSLQHYLALHILKKKKVGLWS